MFVFIMFLLLNISNGAINKFSYVGMWKLRYTNDKFLDNAYTYLKLDIDYSFKLKTIRSNGFLAVKTSKSGKINYSNFYNLFYLILKKKINLNVHLDFINVNKYYYSICGIEIPEYKFTYINSCNIKKHLEINILDNKLIVKDVDKNKLYIFDQCDQYEKRPFIDMSFNTFIFSTILGVFLNIILMKLSY